jgi:hypothetical protein
MDAALAALAALLFLLERLLATGWRRAAVA